MTIKFLKVITTYTTSWPTKLACIILGISFTFSCKNPQKIGLERQLSENPAGVFYTDTFQVFTETVQLEAPSTLNKPNLIVGKFKDNELGEITNVGYSKFKLSGSDSILRISEIESVELIINYDYILGDVSKPLKFNIHALTGDFNQADYNRFSSIAMSEVLASAILDYSDKRSDTINVNNLKSFFSDMKNSIIGKKLKGFAFVPTDQSFAIGLRTGESGFTIKINGFKEDSTVKTPISYSLFIEPYPLDKFKNPIPSRFTQASLTDSNINVLNPANNVAYINELMGIHTKITIPGINSFLNQIKGKYFVTDANFRIPSYKSYPYSITSNQINPHIFMYETINGERYKVGNGNYKTVQQEFVKGIPFISNGPDETKSSQYSSYDYRFFWIEFPFSLNLRHISSGLLPNNPLILAEQSAYYNNGYEGTQSPFTYSFLKGTVPGSGRIQLIIYYKNIN